MGLSWPASPGLLRPAPGGRTPRGNSAGVVAEQVVSAALPRGPHVRARPGGGGFGRGAGRQLRARGGGGARSVVRAGPASLFLPRPAPPGRAPPPARPSSPPRLGLPPSSSSSLKRSSSSLAAWRPWRHGYARRTAAAARPSSSVPPASNWASRARTSALR